MSEPELDKSEELKPENEESTEENKELAKNESRQAVKPCRDCDVPEGLDF